MGYTTDFEGIVKINPPLNPLQVKFINEINRTRRMKRDSNKLMEIYKGEYGNPFATEKTAEAIYGNEGEFFVGRENDRDASILDYNMSPGQSNFLGDSKGQPGLWCQWEVSEDGTTLRWDGGEKFYNYVEWMEYLVNRLFKPWGVVLNGFIEWNGEDSSDKGKIKVKDNVVTSHEAIITYKDDEDEE
jgi:hypothetical protein